MADLFMPLPELVKLNDKNARDMGATDIFNDAPLIRSLYATESSHGTKHSYLKETTAPVIGFRAVNVGIENSYGVEDLVTLDLAYLDATFFIDKAIATGYKGGVEGLFTRKGKKQ